MAIQELETRKEAYPKMIYRHQLTQARADSQVHTWRKLIQFLKQLRTDTFNEDDRPPILKGSELKEIRTEIRREWKERNKYYRSGDPKIVFCEKAQEAVQEQLDRITGVQPTLF